MALLGEGVCWGRRRAFRRQLQTPDLSWPSRTWLTAASLRALRHRLSNIGGHRAPHVSGQIVLPTASAVQFQWTVPGSCVNAGHAHLGGLESWNVTSALLCATPEMHLNAERGVEGTIVGQGGLSPGRSGVEPVLTPPMTPP